MKIVLASNNPGKINEFRALLENFHIDIIPQAELNVPSVEETGLTFVENALIKARHAAVLTGLPALADDSGLVVKALSGAPGIYSSRYAGVDASDQANICKLLQALTAVPDDKRQASFHCVLAFMLHQKDPTPLICEGSWHGKIVTEAKGEKGFGYDPVFYVPSEKKTAAELESAIKNRLSHRQQALQQLLRLLPEKL